MPRMKLINEEKAQSRARVVICWISLAAFTGVGYWKGLYETPTMARGLITILSYLAFSTFWFGMVRRYPYSHPRRRYVSLVADVGIMTVFFHMGGGHVATFYPLFLWIVIGNGIRFGEHFLLKGVAVGTLGFGSVLIFNPYWRANLDVGMGLLLGVIVLPIFYQGALRRLRHMQDLKVELARSRLAEKAKDQFLATMSHEIRTPMNGVLGMAESLRETNLDDDQREQLHIITRSVESLLNIINDILDYSKIAANRLALESVPFDLQEVLSDVQLLLKSSADAKGIGLDFDYPQDAHRHFLGDPTRVRQVVFNLVGNAIKFTHEGKVGLTCKVSGRGERRLVTLAVKDTGIGIPAERLDAVLNQFEQADNSTTREYGGTGLGLAISRQLAVMMGGGLDVQSRLGKGSTFTVTLDLQPCAAPAPKPQRAAGDLPQFGLKGLVVEDNKFNQVVVKRLLERLGILVDIAENGAEALERLDQDIYDVVFMDVRMPVMNGYEATQRIRARGDEVATIPIVAVTADATRNDRQMCLDAGMNVYLSKPVKVDQLVEAIESLPLGSRQAV